MSNRVEGQNLQPGWPLRTVFEIGKSVVMAAQTTLRDIGVGFREAVYEDYLVQLLTNMGMPVERQLAFRSIVDCGRGIRVQRVDLLVERCVVVELKASSRSDTAHVKQVLSYMATLRVRLGLLIDFGVVPIENGVQFLWSRDPRIGRVDSRLGLWSAAPTLGEPGVEPTAARCAEDR